LAENDIIIMYITYKFEFEFWCLTPLSQYFSYIMATSFSGGGSLSTRREPPTLASNW